MISNYITKLFVKAADTNLLAYDQLAPIGLFSYRLVEIIYEVGRDNKFGEPELILIPTEVNVQRRARGFRQWLRCLWKRRNFPNVVKVQELNNSSELEIMTSATSVYNTNTKHWFGIVRYTDGTYILLGI